MSAMREPKEVIEMREALAAFRKAARGVKDSQRGLPRISARPRVQPEAEERREDHEEVTRKTPLVPA